MISFAIYRLIRAVEVEFGQCPTWKPLIQAAKDEHEFRGEGLHEVLAEDRRMM